MNKKNFAKSFFATNQFWIGIGCLIFWAVIFCAPALTSPFWGNNDTWSNLLPVIQYRQSILRDHTLPIYTNLWYGGRYQWQNPLWNFLYLPATLVWLIFPLDWGTRIIFLGHLIFALVAGRKVGSLFFERELEKDSVALILTSPMLPALIAGQAEKVLSWGWVLLAIYFVLNKNFSSTTRGLGAGISLGIVALTGANYYVLYEGIILLPLIFNFKDRKLFICFLAGSLVGLAHLSNVWYLIGVYRGNAIESVPKYSTDLLGILLSLSIGIGKPAGWESWSPIGIPMVILFCENIFIDIKRAITETLSKSFSQKIMLAISLTILFLLATGFLYKGNHFFDTFRVPVRAIAFIALGVSLYVLFSFKMEEKLNQNLHYKMLLVLSAAQICLVSWLIHPTGTIHSPYDPQVQKIADILRADHAKKVWFSIDSLSDTYIDAILMQNDLSLPNVYYGDMGQTISVKGNICGYSFDHLLALAPPNNNFYLELKPDIEGTNTPDRISLSNLQLTNQVILNDKHYNLYRLICDMK